MEYWLDSGSKHTRKSPKRATRIPFKSDRPHYNQRLSQFKLTSFYDRKMRGDSIFTYKILHHQLTVDFSHFFHLNVNERSRRHNPNLIRERSTIKCRTNFLRNLIVPSWKSSTEDTWTLQVWHDLTSRKCYRMFVAFRTENTTPFFVTALSFSCSKTM